MPATYTIAVDWNGDGNFTDTGEDVSARTLERTAVTVRLGRDQARALSPMAPGRGQMELDNRSKDYSPENTSSPLHGNVLPGRDVKITAVLNGTTYGILRAYLDDFDVDPSISGRSVPVTLLDPLARLKQVRVSTGVYHSVRTGEAIGLLLDAAGWDPDLRDLDVGATTCPWWWVKDSDAFTALQQLVDSEGPGALVTVDIDGKIVFRDRHHRLTRSASTTVQATFRDTGTEPNFSAPMVYDHGWRDLVNSVTFSVPVRAVAGELSPVWTSTGPHTLADGQTILINADASAPFVGAVTPEVGTDFQLLSGVAEVSLSRTSGETVTIFVKATNGPAVISDLQLRAYSVATAHTVQVQAEETVSKGRYGARSLPDGRDPVWASLPDAVAIADLILAQRAERLPTVSITVKPGNDTRLTQQLVRDLSDRVRIVEAQTVLDAEFYVEQIEHSIMEAGLFHVTTFGCEKIPTVSTTVFILDSTTQGRLNTNTLGTIGVDSPASVFTLDSSTNGLLGRGLLAH